MHLDSVLPLGRDGLPCAGRRRGGAGSAGGAFGGSSTLGACCLCIADKAMTTPIAGFPAGAERGRQREGGRQLARRICFVVGHFNQREAHVRLHFQEPELTLSVQCRGSCSAASTRVRVS